MGRWIAFRKKSPERYGGLLVHADPGLHEQAAALFAETVPRGARVLDVGAGAGAFSRRLSDLGYRVTAVDRDDSEWKRELVGDGVEFRRIDVERDLASLDGRFDAACCLEVIEHVENPWALLRSIRDLLGPAGYLLLSTPNITSFLSRVLFLRTGRFHQFGDGDVEYGHVNPLTTHELRLIAERVGFAVRDLRPAGTLPLLDLSTLRPKQLGLSAARAVLYPFMGGDKRGWCVLALLQAEDGEP